jgi:hypothetical protein
MQARTGSVRIWHWAHVEHNPHCEAALEGEWHLSWKQLAIEGTQEITVGRRRADILAPGGFTVELQASAMDREEVWARERDWAGQGGIVWIFRADRERAAGRITTTSSFAGYEQHVAEPEKHETLDITWSHAPDRVRSARARSFLDIVGDQLLSIGGWRPGSSPLTGYGWRVPKDAVVRNVLLGTVIPEPVAGDPAEVIRQMEAQKARQKREKRRREAERQEAERQRQRQRERWQQEAERQRAEQEQREEQLRRDRIHARMRMLADAAQQESRPEPLPQKPASPITRRLRGWRLRREAKRAEAERARGRGRAEDPRPSGRGPSET